MPLTIGPMVVALGFVLFLRPGIGGSYWTTFFPAVVSLGVGMAISVAPLTTAVMESVSVDEAAMASGINNAVLRMAGLLAIAVFGLVLASGFNRALDRSLARMQEVSPAVRENVDRQRSQLAGGQTSDSRIRQAIDDAFLSGYRDVIWLSVGLSLLSAASARMIGSNASTHRANGTSPGWLSGSAVEGVFLHPVEAAAHEEEFFRILQAELNLG